MSENKKLKHVYQRDVEGRLFSASQYFLLVFSDLLSQTPEQAKKYLHYEMAREIRAADVAILVTPSITNIHLNTM